MYIDIYLLTFILFFRDNLREGQEGLSVCVCISEKAIALKPFVISGDKTLSRDRSHKSNSIFWAWGQGRVLRSGPAPDKAGQVFVYRHTQIQTTKTQSENTWTHEVSDAHKCKIRMKFRKWQTWWTDMTGFVSSKA